MQSCRCVLGANIDSMLESSQSAVCVSFARHVMTCLARVLQRPRRAAVLGSDRSARDGRH